VDTGSGAGAAAVALGVETCVGFEALTLLVDDEVVVLAGAAVAVEVAVALSLGVEVETAAGVFKVSEPAEVVPGAAAAVKPVLTSVA
jgi:hypothetical protein